MRKTQWFEAFLDNYGIIHAYIRLDFYAGQSEKFYLKDQNQQVHILPAEFLEESAGYKKYRLTVDEALIELGQRYLIYEEHGQSCILEYGLIVRTKRFNQEYVSNREDFGATITNNQTKFVLWAPTAHAVSLKLLTQAEPRYYRMNRQANGIWQVELPKNCHGQLYRYVVYVNNQINETIDPYAVSSNANAEYSCVVDFSQLKIEMYDQALPVLNNTLAAVIGELSVRDFSSDPATTIQAKGKYLGLIEANRVNADLKPVGWDYLITCGYTHVQLMPVYDFATIDEEIPDLFYNWGYDPVQYNALEGSYSSNPADPLARIKEFLTVVATFHRHGIRVNMDVVYNHMYDLANSSFEKIVPYYYFRLNEHGVVSNGSFCGNDVDSSNLMVRKFILDSLKHWVINYHIDGFRFDLMGILDIETMLVIKQALKQLKPNLMLYGEGWDMPTSLPEGERATLANAAQLPGLSFFNDFYRDHVKGPTALETSHLAGYCLGDISYLGAFRAALLANADPAELSYLFQSSRQSISYVECHDNYTLWDKIELACPADSHQEKIDRQKLVIGSQLVSLGIIFFQLGQEGCRSKQHVFNSYRSGDLVNQLNYTQLHHYQGVKEYYQALLEFRQTSQLFLDVNTAAFLKRVSFTELPHQLLLYQLNDINYLYYKQLFIFFNPTKHVVTYEFSQPADLLFDKTGKTELKAVSKIGLAPISLTILAQ